MAENAKERLIRYLQDAHAAETGIDDVIKGFIDDTDDPNIKAVFQQHRIETQSQAQRLEARLKALGADPSGGKGFLNMVLARMSEIMHGAHDEYDKNTQNLIKAYSIEHLERGMYESLIAYSSVVGDDVTAALGRQIQAEEEATAQKLFPLIQQYAKTALAGTEGLAGNRIAYTA
ncbi:ferritin-like domain-containing protein [Fimbriimonas ginsengisoli]|uniref:Uncharacterized protein n=1 Tax=Fimbriimonas ginsengisoli Gsoil 348 TaxID=661478 RepID=A0A068NKR5_FIMGI|nr:DUF892 family protein [Fimbriimonas ginsengisoli]AIE84173.1 hypothetical protein OP10G_0805 [Fimbriimonas ginsengisoli Gsoil 348]